MKRYRVHGRAPRFHAEPNVRSRVIGSLSNWVAVVGVPVLGEGVWGGTQVWIKVRWWKFRRPVYIWGGLVTEDRYDNTHHTL